MINAMYAREFSKKQTVYFEQHSRIGDIKYTRAPYGYLVDKEKNILVPDPVTAPVVQMIFRWFLLGVEFKEIYERLNDMNLPSPYEYKRQTEGYAEMKRFIDYEDKWKNSSVSQILHSEVYIGDRVLGKKRKILYKGIAVHRTAPDEWITHKNTHEPLVTTEDFEKVKEKLRSRQIINKAKVEAFHQLPDLPTDHFRGKVYCLECGRRMIYMRSKGIGNRKVDKCALYRCYDESQSGITNEVRKLGKAYTGSINKDGSRRDCGKRVNEELIKIIALDAIQNLLHAFFDIKQAVKRMKTTKDGGKYHIINREIIALQEQLRSIQSRLEGLYDDYTAELLSLDEYLELKEHFITEEHHTRNKLSELEAEQRKIDKSLDQFLAWCNKLEGCALENRELEQSLLDELIDSIHISDNYEVQIRFKCTDILDEAKEVLNIECE